MDSQPRSEILSPRALSALNRIGDLMLPRSGDYPSFSELGCIEHVDLIVAHAPREDVASLNTLLGILSFKPTFVLRFIVYLTQHADSMGPFAGLCRMLDMGLRSIVVSLYYSGLPTRVYTGPTPLELIGYRLNIVRN